MGLCLFEARDCDHYKLRKVGFWKLVCSLTEVGCGIHGLIVTYRKMTIWLLLLLREPAFLFTRSSIRNAVITRNYDLLTNEARFILRSEKMFHTDASNREGPAFELIV